MSRKPALNTNTAKPALGVALITLAGLTGCSSSRHSGAMNLHEKAGHATIAINPQEVEGDFTQKYFKDRSDDVFLPTEYLSEARADTAEIEARRAAAQSITVASDADRSESLASADAQFQRAVSSHDIARAEAARMRSVFESRTAETENKIEADSLVNGARHHRNERLLGASVKEWRSEVEQMRSGAENDWTQSLADHERMVGERMAVSARGDATIEQMIKAVNLTEDRAGEKVRTLRSDSRAVAEQADAAVQDLNQQVKSVAERSGAEVTDLTQRAKSLKTEAAAQVSQTLAEAESLEKQNAQEGFKLAQGAAAVTFEGALAEAEELRLSAETDQQLSAAEIERQRAEAKESFELARATLNEGRDWIASQLEKNLAEVSVKRAQADAIENKGRASFLKAEIDARVAAVREQASHDRKLAKDEYAMLKSGAVAEARALEARLAKRIASQVKAGEITVEPVFPGDANNPSADESTPKLTRAQKKAQIIEPARVADFRTSLAKAAMIRVEADADTADAHAIRDGELAKFSAWWDEKNANQIAWNAKIDAEARKFNATVEQTLAKANSIVAGATAERNRSLVDADSGRKESLARISSLRATAETTRRKSSAKVQQLLARADSARRNGQSRVKALEVQRDATIRRGDAKSRQLLVEADSLETSQSAVVAQMHEEIKAAGRILTSELARLDQSAVSFLAIAKANFEEGVAMADTFERITVANAAELTAQHMAAQKQAKADINFMRDLNDAQQLAREAEVERFNADATLRLAQAEADDMSGRAQIDALHRIAQATVEEQFTVASAEENAVAARFESRVAATESDRNRAYAEVYLARQQDRANSEKAAANAQAFDELSASALTRLSTAAKSFNKTAQHNWNSRLAMPVALPTPKPANIIYNATTPDFNLEEFANVPTNFE